MKRYAVLLLLLFIAALTHAPDQQISAEYDELVAQESARIAQQAIDLEDQQSIYDVISEPLRLVYGTHHYTVRATDSRENPAEHTQAVTAQQPFSITLLNPPHGVADSPGYSLSLETEKAATCQWRFKTPDDQMNWQTLESSDDGLLHAETGFGERYRAARGEYVPVEISCEAGSDEARLLIEAGWNDHDLEAPTSTRTPEPLTHPQDPLTITAQTTTRSTCTLTRTDGEYSEESILAKDHLFDGLTRNKQHAYLLECEDAKGDLHGTEIPLPYNPGAAPTISVTSDHLTTQQRYPLVVRTNQPATCTWGETKLGPLAGGLEHQRTISLEDGTTQETITCKSAQSGETQSTPFSVTLDREHPQLEITRAQRCGEDVRVTLETSSDDVTHAVISDNLGAAATREWRATITQPLSPEADTVYAQAVDAAGNVQQAAASSEITETDDETCEYAHPQDLQLQTPNPRSNNIGQTTRETFALEVDSEHPSTCTADGQAMSGETQHELADAQEHLSPGENSVTVTCTDPAGQRTSETYTIYWDLEEPEVSVEARPPEVDSLLEPHTTVHVTSSQPVACALDREYLTNEYDTAHEIQAAVTPGGRTLTAYCQDPHGREVAQSVTVADKYPSEMRINAQLPAATNQQTVWLNATTSQEAHCTATYQDTSVDLETLTGYEHTVQAQLPEGSYDVTFTCAEAQNPDKQASAKTSLTVDTTAPQVAITSAPLTCGTNTYRLTANATDNIGLASYKVVFADNTYTPAAKDTTSGGRFSHELKNLALEEGQTYTLTLTGYDHAGNPSGEASAQIKAVNKSVGACDTEAPTGFISSRDTIDGANVTIYCEDDRECAEQFLYAEATPGGECEPQDEHRYASNGTTKKHSEPIPLNETRLVCAQVSDAQGNSITKYQTVTVRTDYAPTCSNGQQDGAETGVDCGGPDCPRCGPPADLCSNGQLDEQWGETDVDCGGIDACGATCDVGQSCSSRMDCESKTCIGGTCAEPTCSDNVKNGQETDRDCGGPDCQTCSQGRSCSQDSDCETGMCEAGTCADSRLDRNDPSEEEPAPVPEENSLAGLLLVVLGSLSIIGGGGWMYWEHGQEAAAATTKKHPQDLRPETIETPKREGPDFSESALREEARDKRRKQRRHKREQLLGEFSNDEPQKKPEKKKNSSKSSDEDVFDELEDVANR